VCSKHARTLTTQKLITDGRLRGGSMSALALGAEMLQPAYPSLPQLRRVPVMTILVVCVRERVSERVSDSAREREIGRES